MKLWLIERSENAVSWGEYIGFVIRAETKEDALRLAIEKSDRLYTYENISINDPSLTPEELKEMENEKKFFAKAGVVIPPRQAYTRATDVTENEWKKATITEITIDGPEGVIFESYLNG